MKKTFLLKSLLLLCVLVVGSGTMWADEVTLVSGSGNSGYAIPDGWTSSGTVEGGSYLKLDDGTITSPEFAPHTGLSFTYSVATFGSGTNHPLTIRILNASTNAVIVEKTTSTPTSSTYISPDSPLSLGDVDVAFKIQLSAPTGKGIRLRNYSVTGTPAGGGSSLSDSDLALTDAPIALSFDLYNNSSAQTVSYTTSSTGAVTISGGEDYVTTSISGNTITVTPKAVTPSAQTITVSQAADNTYKAGSATFTVTITDSTPILTHIATFSVNGTTTSNEFEEGAAITFPANPADIEGKSFVGWTETAISGTTDETPTFVTSATMGNENITFYAVFAEQEGEPGWTETALSNIATTDIFVFSDGNYAMSNDKGTSAAPATVAITVSDGKITSDVADNLKWNVSGDANNGYTFYPNGSTTTWMYCSTTAASGSNNNIRVGTGNRKLWIFDGDNYLVTNDNSTDRYLSIYNDQDFRGYINTDLAFVPKFYKYSEGSYSGYCTTVAADTREEAGLGFVESTAIVEWYNAAQYTGQALTNPHSVSPITWTSSNEGVATVENGTVTVLALGETTIKASFDGDNDYKKGEASYTLTVQDTREEPTVTIHDTFITHTNVFEGTAAGKLTASVKYNDNTIEGATVTWSGDNDAVATINATSGSVDLVAAGTVTFTAAYAGNEDYKAKTATYEMTVTYSDPNAPGTVNNPYTVAEARAAIDAGTGVTEVYARGIVSEIVTPFNSQFGNITYNISEDGSTTSDQLQAYRGKGIGGANFTSADDIQVGDVVVVYGDLKKHEDTYEFAQNNQLVSLKRARIIVDQTSYEADAKYTGTDDGYVSVTINFTHENVTMHGGNSQYASDFNAVVMCDANGNPTTYDWLKFMLFVPEDNVGFFYFNDNNGAPRTAYLKLHGVDADGLDVYSELITITQDGVAINVDETEIDASNIQSKNISVTYKNFNPVADDFGVVYCDENGDELSGGYDWIEKIAQWIDPQIEGTATILFKFDLNTGSAPRTAYMKIYAMNGNDRVYSELITITQEVYVEPTKVSFYVNGGPIEYSYLEEGDPIVFPEVSNIDGMTFLGWTSNEINGTTDTAPEFVDVTSATMGTESINYYAVFALLVAPGTTSTVTDELTNTLIGVSGSSYSSWEGKKASSDAVYKGNSAGGNDAIQLRTNNSNSGIVTTTSGGKLKKVTVEWNGNTANDRTLDIYGKNTAYSAASDLYGTDTQGTKIGSIVCGKSTELTISGDYTFIGLRSNSGAMYLDKITIEWETGTPNTYSDYCTTIPAMLTVTIAEACTDGSKYYGTFSSSSAFKVPANVTVSEIGINNGGTMNVQEYAGGAIVPANTGVMVSATTFGEHKLIISSEEGTSVLGADNRLRPTGDDNGITATAMAAADESCVFYRLTMHNDTKLGFWWGAAEGAAFAVGPNKAYLAVPASVAGARNGFAFGDDATGINNVNINLNDNDNCYDLQGRKVSTPGKGLYIVNGKKVVIK